MRQSSPRTGLVVVMVLALFCGIATFFGLGIAYNETLTPNSSANRFEGIGGDGWIQDGSAIQLRDLASRGNRLALFLDPWRPSNAAPAHLEIMVCGQKTAEFIVNSDAPTVISLNGMCNPRTIEFKVVNPVLGSPSDRRKLGVQLKQAIVQSRLGVPVAPYDKLVYCTAGLLLLAIVVLGITGVSILAGVSFLVPLAGFWLISGDDNLELRTQIPFWAFCMSITCGAWIASRFAQPGTRPRSNFAEPREGPGLFEIGIVFLIVAAGAALRLYGIKFGLPANFHPDEVPKVNAIMRMVDAQDLNPRYFLHPSLLLYSSYLVNTIAHWFGIDGSFRTTAFLAGRTVSLIGGTLSIYFLYAIGRRLFKPSTGIGAALLLAVFPLHVACSRYMKEDALLVCFVLATTLAVLKAVQENRKEMLYLAGALAGCAASTKYPGLLAAGIVLSAPWLRTQSFLPDLKFLRHSIIAVFFVPVFFVLCSPYSVLTPDKFIKDFKSESHHMERGHTVTITAASQLWMYHFWRSILPGVTPIGALLASAGLGFLLWRRRINDLFIVGLFLMYYLPAEWVRAKPEPQPERYIMPCLPFLALALVELLRSFSGTRLKALIPVVAALAFISPAIRSTQLATEVPKDTRSRMAHWMNRNLPHGSKVALDWKPYAPPLSAKNFEVTYLLRSTILSDLRISELRKAGYDYLVLSSLFYERYFTQPRTPPSLRQLFRTLYEQAPIIHEIAPKYGTYGFNNPKLTLFSLREEDFSRLNVELALKREGKLEHTSNEMKAQFKWALK